ncbi:MAG: helix-turn-helix domain-containing protein [Caulobacteraceae bacterium]|nr:helix-turn-helix domain-containing protein [Caulobacteraceae bacterium]
MNLFPIRNDEDHARAVREIAAHWNAPDDSDEAACMDALATLVDRYERQRWPIEAITPLEAIKFAMEQNGYTQSDLATLLESRSRASEILAGKRGLTLEQIRLVSKHWHVPVAALVGAFELA